MGSATSSLDAFESAPSAVAAETRTTIAANPAEDRGSRPAQRLGASASLAVQSSERDARDQQCCGADLTAGGSLEAVERAASIPRQKQPGERRQAGVAGQQDSVVPLSGAAEATAGDSRLPAATDQQHGREGRQRCQRQHGGGRPAAISASTAIDSSAAGTAQTAARRAGSGRS